MALNLGKKILIGAFLLAALPSSFAVPVEDEETQAAQVPEKVNDAPPTLLSYLLQYLTLFHRELL
jgi:hypothetical protein